MRRRIGRNTGFLLSFAASRGGAAAGPRAGVLLLPFGVRTSIFHNKKESNIKQVVGPFFPVFALTFSMFSCLFSIRFVLIIFLFHFSISLPPVLFSFSSFNKKIQNQRSLGPFFSGFRFPVFTSCHDYFPFFNFSKFFIFACFVIFFFFLFLNLFFFHFVILCTFFIEKPLCFIFVQLSDMACNTSVSPRHKAQTGSSRTRFRQGATNNKTVCNPISKVFIDSGYRGAPDRKTPKCFKTSCITVISFFQSQLQNVKKTVCSTCT